MDKRKTAVRTSILERWSAGRYYVPVLFAVLLLALAGLMFMPKGETAFTVSAQTQEAVPVNRGMLGKILDLGSATDFAMFARSIEGTSNSFVKGNMGVTTRNGFRGISAGNVQGGMFDPDGPRNVRRADRELGAAYRAISQLPCTRVDDNVIEGKTFAPGVYCFSSVEIAQRVVLDGRSDPTSIFVFKITGDLRAAANSTIDLINGAEAQNVFFVTKNDTIIGGGAQFRGNIIARQDILIGNNAVLGAKTLSVNGRIRTGDSSLGGGTGVVEICKFQAPGTTGLSGVFTFNVAGQTIQAPIGGCSGPVTVAAGQITITEAVGAGNFRLVGVSSSVAGAVISTNLPARSAVINVREGTVANQTVVNFTNQRSVNAVVEICKAAADGDPDVAGIFRFTIDMIADTDFFAPVGGCSGPITVPVLISTPTSPARVRVTEWSLDGFFLESASTLPTTRLVPPVVFNAGIDDDGNEVSNLGGGYATVDLLPGGALNQTIVNFVNRTNPGVVKVCKIAGPGIPIGTRFRFTVTGTFAGNGPGPGGEGEGPSAEVIVPAGPAGQGGFCNFVPGTFVIGTDVTVTEELPPLDPVPSGSVLVSRIQTTVPASFTDLDARTVTFPSRTETVEAEFTNIIFNPTVLKVCKLAGDGIDVGDPFDFNITVSDVGGLVPTAPIAPVTVQAGPAGQGGFCRFVNGPYPATAANPGVGTFNIGSSVTIVEDEVDGVVVDTITSPTGPITTNTGTGTATLNMVGPISEVLFTNEAGDGGPDERGVRFDFDGDGKADPSIFTPGTAIWAYLESSNGGALRTAGFGSANDKPVPADYDGDGKTDYAVYRDGHWFVMGSTNVTMHMYWGESTDIPQPGDYDGDGKADFVVYRPSTGFWWMQLSSGGGAVYHWGISTDKPVAADYDGDGKTDITVYRDGTWWSIGTTMGMRGLNFGIAGDIPTPADFDGDGKTDVAVYRGGTWYVLETLGAFRSHSHGAAGDRPVPADYDGDGKADLATFSPSNGAWTIKRSSMTDAGASIITVTLGSGTDIPLPTL